VNEIPTTNKKENEMTRQELNREIGGCNEAIMALRKGVPHLSWLICETGCMDHTWYEKQRNVCAKAKAKLTK
jgi:hypothetical protein